MAISADLGDWLRGERRAHQFSQEQLETECGVPQATISVLERGVIDLDVGILRSLRRITETLNISFLDALYRAGFFVFPDWAEADRDAIEGAMLLRLLGDEERRNTLHALREKTRENQER